MTHVVLLGDSIFDNKAYIADDPDVITQLCSKIPSDWQATLCAVDGNCVEDMHRQIKRLPSDATHLFVSIGGNDALGHTDILYQPTKASTEVFKALADLSTNFGNQYRKLLEKLVSLGLPLTVCTIYYPNFYNAQDNRLAIAALATFNDVIIREAFRARIPLIDLRLMFTQAEDYANEIEPSAVGGEKIVTTITKIVSEHNFDHAHTQVFY